MNSSKYLNGAGGKTPWPILIRLFFFVVVKTTSKKLGCSQEFVSENFFILSQVKIYLAIKIREG